MFHLLRLSSTKSCLHLLDADPLSHKSATRLNHEISSPWIFISIYFSSVFSFCHIITFLNLANCETQVPVEIVKKVPADQCEEVPGVKCFFELVDVETPVCHEVPVEDFLIGHMGFDLF